ncbi:hypothetical protein CBR_g36670 [Chara braunii]|uniref:Uncharacterized protein n=1 Tax=Chara braunii TaxID=69332 RepID=A0A388LLD9_CHABU|nr:hypothetical protein CBR_g36670 [Chara braunii]|eukprot:GBG83053.1 hypothetical protein CBR_g36670 [Chara braunii]
MSAVSVASASHFTPTACAAVSAFGSSSRVMYESFSQRRTKRPRAKKVSWAPDERLCQVRTFASDDAPSQFSMSMFRSQQGQGQLQMHYQQQQMERNNMPSLPPGFGPRPFTRPNNSMAAVAAMTAQLTWRSPDAVEIPPSWRVVAGNESNEVAVQKERENRVLEAVYPRPSAIPDSPAEPVTAEEDYDDGMTPSISVVAQEDEEMAEVQEDGEHNEMREEVPTPAAREGNPNMSPWVAASQGQGMSLPCRKYLPVGSKSTVQVWVAQET